MHASQIVIMLRKQTHVRKSGDRSAVERVFGMKETLGSMPSNAPSSVWVLSKWQGSR